MLAQFRVDGGFSEHQLHGCHLIWKLMKAIRPMYTVVVGNLIMTCWTKEEVSWKFISSTSDTIRTINWPQLTIGESDSRWWGHPSTSVTFFDVGLEARIMRRNRCWLEPQTFTNEHPKLSLWPSLAFRVRIIATFIYNISTGVHGGGW